MINDSCHSNRIINQRVKIDLGFLKLVIVLIAVALPGLALKNDEAVAANAADQPGTYDSAFGYGKQSLGISGGYGLALPVGGTDAPELEDIEFVYVTPRWGVGITDPLGGSSWYRGNFELLLEGTFLYMLEPKSGIAGGIAPGLRYNFLTGTRVIPFLQAGVGFIALDADLTRQSDGLNFILQTGLGLHYFITQRSALTGEWRFHHISNASIHDKNAGINSSLFMLGLTFFLR
ncbi:MAG TPA: acyloxyacyl hydrolase [Candidatus Binatia bacterium]